MNTIIAEERRRNETSRTKTLFLRQKIIKVIWDFKNENHVRCFKNLHPQLLDTFSGILKLDELVGSFRDLFRKRKTDGLCQWIKKYADYDSSYIQSFINGLKQDENAISLSIQEPWSNGVVEGHINRLKMIKRMMYGRAGFQVLKNRVLFQW
ncbi:transposase [Aneurinibacillus sp. Ricciae_BoGa-3]|uniref:transposase n=1 Tax=Aneurinibacillus sp. Ricciae_BoGa-3 TaxID=3022697 RepID=UPI002340E39B|nr:transposase [Aneurinibacillus sp. Ricciae_BoGa-3]WCK52515.1 transposase [Aneurinibacillus sp. Ricciae_BoGa-3]